MSRSVITPVVSHAAPGKIYELAPARGGGRFQTLSVLAYAGMTIPNVRAPGPKATYQFDVWECVGLGGGITATGGGPPVPAGATLRLDEEEIFAFANECPIQPGQTWIHNVSNEVFEMRSCEHRASAADGDIALAGPGWYWNGIVRQTGTGAAFLGALIDAHESILLGHCSRVDGLDAIGATAAMVAGWDSRTGAAAPAKVRETNGPCRCCGAPALDLAFVIECSNPKCRNYRAV